MEVLTDSKQDFFANIPPEILTDILSRLPTLTVIRCKRVSKSWFDLVKSLEFAKLHHSKSVRSLALDEDRPLTLAVFRGDTEYEILESVDTRNSNFGHHWNVVFKFNFPHPEPLVHSSADGLLFLLHEWPHNLFICNPITREYIKLPPLPDDQENTFGFGVSKLTRKYKVVRIFHEYKKYSVELSPCKCEVYTLGTGSWRGVPAGVPHRYMSSFTSSSVSLNGNLHWLVQGLHWEDYGKRISLFDLETECFSTFSIPPRGQGCLITRTLCLLGDKLCLCYHDVGYVLDIWLMNKYGDDKSWTKVYTIEGSINKHLGTHILPMKMFKNGNMLLASLFRPKLYCYSSNTFTVREVEHTKPFADIGSIPTIYVPSLLPLKIFAMENVCSF